MDAIECTIRELKKLQRKNLPLEIYYAEEMTDGEIEWSVDVLNNIVDDNCKTSWFLTIMSKAEDDAYRKEFSDDSPIEEYEVVIDAPFSDAVVCRGVETWLKDNNINLKVIMIDYKDAAPYSGYIKELMEIDLDDEINHAVPLE